MNKSPPAFLSNVHTEKIFEDELCGHLATNGWSVRTHRKDATAYSRELALFPDDLLAFVQETQPAEWAKFKRWHNGQSEQMFVKRVAEQLDKHGTLHLLRHGFKDRDAKFFLCQFRPAHRKNPQLWAWYDKNRLTAIRQLHYSLHNENSIDVVLFVNGLPTPFHTYSMRQAIEEGFILDVLKNYTSYKMFYKLGSQADEKLVPSMKAKKVLARFAVLHPYNISQKVVVIVEHFREHVAAKIGGKAKAMVVTDSRKAAVRYKLAMDKYIKERGYDKELRALVAFSGKVDDPDSGPDEFTERSMNPDIKGQEPSEAFKDDVYRVLLVANKYQTGFDQPLLHTMYVDKRLAGVLAVQTLSRLNRTCGGKEDTFVLDFVNKPEEILASFQPYYRTAALEDVTDPNIVHELQIKLDKAKVYFQTEVDAFAEAFFDPKRKQAGLHAHLKPASDRFGELDEEDAEQFRKDLGSFLRLYDFLSQIVSYGDVELEKLYVFGKNLMPRIAEQGTGSSILELDSDVRLTHYRLQKLGEQKLDLASGEIVKLKPLSEVGTGKSVDDEQRKLSEIVEKMNDLFAGNLSEADMVGYVTTIKGKLLESEILAEQAENNTEQQFIMGDFKDVLTDIIIEGQGAHNSIADQLLKDDRIFAAMQGMLAKMVFQAFAQRRAGT